jgi:hypothetical protein
MPKYLIENSTSMHGKHSVARVTCSSVHQMGA